MKTLLLNKSISITVLGLLALGLGACSSTDIPPPPCPDIQILSAASKLTRFKPGPGRDIIDVLHDETITGFASACEYDVDETGAGDLTVWLAPTIQSTRGPANQSSESTFDYFIVITDSQKKVLNKLPFSVSIAYQQNLTQLSWTLTEPNALSIPLSAGQTGEDFQVFIGLQLTRDELEYQRNLR
jgi:hypothetical protein